MRCGGRESVLGGTDIRKLQNAREGLLQFKVLVTRVANLGFRENEEEIRLGFRLCEMIYKLRDVEESDELLFLSENVKNKKFLRFESMRIVAWGSTSRHN